MKKQLLNLSVALVATMLFAGSALAQWAPKTVSVKHVAVPPTIDGLNREWVDVPAQDIDVPFKTNSLDELVTFSANATFKAVWADTAVYVLVTVPDDDFYPAIDAASTSTWLFDKPELYFDNNATILEVGEANCGAMHANSGHHQFAPSFQFTDNTNYQWAYDVTLGNDDASATYFVEYALGTSVLVNRAGDTLDAFAAGTVMGFDVTAIDQDEAVSTDPINRINWSNNCVDTRTDGVPGESWSTEDASGEFTLSADAIVLPTSTKEITFDASAISPNVTSTTFTVVGNATNVVVINSIGQVVKEVNNNNVIDVAELPAGMYIVRINNNTTSKLLKR